MIFRFISDWKRRQGMAFREVLVTQVREVLRAWLAGAGKRPAARRAGVDVKTAARYIRAAQAAGLARDGDEAQLTDELLGQVVAAVRPARPAGHGPSWEVLAARQAEITAWVKDGLLAAGRSIKVIQAGQGVDVGRSRALEDDAVAAVCCCRRRGPFNRPGPGVHRLLICRRCL